METPNNNLCRLAFELNQDLAIMAGECELLLDRMELQSQPARQLQRVLEMTFSMADKINGHSCRMVTCAARNPNQYMASAEGAESRALAENRSGSNVLDLP